jgi:biotin carboxylase
MRESVSSANGIPPPKVLLADTNRWALAARLAIALAESGCEVYGVCPPPHHALMKTHAVKRVFRYDAFRPIESLEAAIEAADPDLVVPSCDRSAEDLHKLYAKAQASGSAGNKVVGLLERSLGLPGSYPIVSSRFKLLALAQEEGIRVPKTIRVSSLQDIDPWLAREPFPWVIKADGTWGGVGVRVVHSKDEVEPSWIELARMSRFTRALKRLTVNRDPFPLHSWWQRVERNIVVQSYIQGRPANCTAFAWNGKVLSLIGVEVVRSEGSTGPASIVRIVENDQMKFAANKIASRLGLSGFFGLDFMIEDGTENAFLIEMNPRITPPCHLRLGKGRDAAGALWAQLVSQPIPDSAPVTRLDLISYQPRFATTNDGMAARCFVDVPVGEPELARELLHPFPDRTVLFRLVQYLSRKPSQSDGEDRLGQTDHYLERPKRDIKDASV